MYVFLFNKTIKHSNRHAFKFEFSILKVTLLSSTLLRGRKRRPRARRTMHHARMHTYIDYVLCFDPRAGKAKPRKPGGFWRSIVFYARLALEGERLC